MLSQTFGKYLICALALVLGSLAQCGRAAVISYFAECYAISQAGSANCEYIPGASSSNPVFVQDSTSINIPDGGYYGAVSASASYSIVGDYGRLGLSVAGSSNSSVPSINPSGAVLSARAGGNARVAFYDTLTITGAPLGTPIIIQFSFDLDGQLTRSSSNGSTFGGVKFGWNLNGQDDCYLVVAGPFSGCDAISTQGTFTAPAGYPFVVVVELTASGIQASSDGAFQVETTCPDCTWLPGSASISALFDHTLLTYLEPIGAGLTLVSESGHDYSTPTAVSSPPTLMLLLTGCLFFVTRAGGMMKVGH